MHFAGYQKMLPEFLLSSLPWEKGGWGFGRPETTASLWLDSIKYGDVK